MGRRVIYVVSLLVAFSALASADQKPWIEIRSPHFRVLTNGGEKNGRKVARDFEEMRYVFASRFPSYRLESGAPLVILAARDEETAKSLEPLLWKRSGAKPLGLYYHGWEKQYALVRLDTWSETLSGEQIVFHEYTHSILHMNLHWLPLWMDEGIAEFYAYTQFDENRIVLGSPTVRFRVLRSLPPIPIETLIAVDHNSPYYHDEDKVDLFYAESWALVHFMTFGPGMEGGAKISQFFDLLQKRVEQKQAFLQVFGDFKKMDFALSQYVSGLTLPAGAIGAPPHLDETTFTSRDLSIAETEAELGGFHLWNHYPPGARPLAEQAIKDDPKMGLPHEEEGFLLFQEGKTAAAEDEFSQAVALDPNLYLALFAKTMLSPLPTSDTPSDENAFRLALISVLSLNPKFAPAYVQLARLALRQGKFEEALSFSNTAEDLEPWRAGYHVQTGQILLRMGKGRDAAAFAQYVAPRWFGSDHNEAVELWNEVPADQRPAGDAPSETAPRDTQEVGGTIKTVTCGEQEKDWAFVLDHAGQTLTFRRKGGFDGGFSDTLWYGEDHFGWCHNLEGLRAVVHYRPPSDSTYSGDLAELEIRNDLPPSPPTATQQAAPATPNAGH